MKSTGADCVDETRILAIAEGDHAGADESAHLASCARCRARLEAAREDARLCAELAQACGPEPERSSAGPLVPGYRIFEEIHRGAQGVVHRAEQLATKRTVAVKLLHRGALASMRERHRFEREVELLATLHHPNVVTAYDSGRTRDGGFFLAMEYVDGVTLDRAPERLTSGRRPPPSRAAVREAVGRFLPLVAGVAAAHQRGIIHRDLKPQNVLVDRHGVPHILDFGVARGVETGHGAAGVPGRTLEGEFVGTLAYAAPEQVAGNPSLVDTRADVYALGSMLYLLLTAHPPIELGGSLSEVVDAIRHREPEPPSRRNPAIDHELGRVLLRALAKEPAERYGSAASFEQDLRRYLAGEPVDAMLGRRLYLVRKVLVRHRAAVAVSALFVVLLAGYGITMAVLYDKAEAANIARSDALEALLGVVQSEDLHRRIDEETATRLLSRIEQSLRDHLMAQSADAWRHFREIGLRQLRRGDAAAALRQFETASAMLADAGRTDDAAAADLLHQSGRALWFLERYRDAEAKYTRALEIQRSLGPQGSEGVAMTLTHLGATYRALGELDLAEGAQRDALAIRLRLFGPDDERYAASLNNLGVLLRERARHGEALDLFRDALRIVRTCRDRGTATATAEALGAALHNVGLEELSLGRLAEAERSLVEALSVKASELEDDHRSILASRIELARLRLAQGRRDDAIEIARDVLERRERTLGLAHADSVEAKHFVESLERAAP